MLIFLFFLFSSTYFVEFEDAKGIERDMKIFYKGFEIGKVKDIEIGENLKPHLEISIKRKYKNLIREGCAIKYSNDKLELIFVNEKNKILPPNSTIKGLKSPMDEFLYGLKRLKENFKKSKFHKELEEIVDEMKGVYEKGKDEFKKQWPLFKEKLNNLKEKAKGDKKAEEDLEKAIKEGEEKYKE